MLTAIRQARAPRGTDDAGNCWLADQRPSGELSHARVPQIPPHAVHTDGNDDLGAATEEAAKEHNDTESKSSCSAQSTTH